MSTPEVQPPATNGESHLNPTSLLLKQTSGEERESAVNGPTGRLRTRRSAVALSPFDKVVLTTLLVLVLLAALVIGLGDQVGTQVVSVSPADGATDVSTQTVLQITFDQRLAPVGSGFPISMSPPVSGTLRWGDKTVTFIPAQSLAPNTTYTVTLTADMQSQQGRPLIKPLIWQFKTRQPRLLYAAPDAQLNDQLFVLIPGGQTTQLTQEEFGIWDFALAPDGATLTYAAMRQDGGSDLWEVAIDGSNRRELVACPEAACSGAAWALDGSRLIYERRDMLVPGAAPGPPRLWWFDPVSTETVPVFEDKQWIGYGARWSPDSRWLTYVSPSNQGVQVYNIEDGRNFLIPSRMGGLAVWSPQGDALLVSDILPQEEGFTVHLLRANPTTGQLTDLSGSKAIVEDTSPTWSPDGAWIAFTRKPAGASMGKQIWLMRPDGSETHYLTNEPDIHHGLPEWSPDSRFLIYQRSPLKELGAQPSIWLLDVETKQAHQLIAPGNRPTWLP